MARARGYLRCHRKSMDSGDPYWSETPFDRWRARWDLISSASHSLHVREIGGETVLLDRGQLVASHFYLAARWGWSTKKVRTFLARLIEAETLRIAKKTAAGTVYEVVSYETYQPRAGQSERQSEGQSDGKSEGTASKGLTGGAGRAKGRATGTAKGDKRMKGSEGRDRKKGKNPPPWVAALPPLPAALDVPEFREVWAKRIEERVEKKSKGRMTPTQADAQYRKLLRVLAVRGISGVVACVERATEAGWSGVVYERDLEPETAKPFQPKDPTKKPRTRRRIE